MCKKACRAIGGKRACMMCRISRVCGVIMMSEVIGFSRVSGAPGVSGPLWEPVDNSGAALLWTSDLPVIEKARELIGAGAFTKAEALLRDGAVFMGEGGQRTRDDSLETIRRIRRDFHQTEDELVANIRKSINDFTAKDLRRLVDEGHVTCRVIDGEVSYFRREPGVMYRFCDEVKRRRGQWNERRRAGGRAVGASSGPLLGEDRAH